MSVEIKKEIQLEIAHVLFIDIVSYSKLSINEQRAAKTERPFLNTRNDLVLPQNDAWPFALDIWNKRK
jgi:hypothetical protein